MIKTAISEKLLNCFNDFLATKMGLYFPKTSLREFEKKLGPVAKEFGFDDLAKCLEWLLREPITQNKIDVLAYYLTIGETYFFRDKRLFYLLEYEVLPAILKKRLHAKSLRIWSAACCSGEEPYSIAILLNEMLGDIKDWSISIYGIDINQKFLQKAREGVYKAWSFRSTSKSLQNKYFKKQGDHFILNSKIKKMVHFSYANLVEKNPSFLKDIDLIVCNNVLIYFSAEQIQKTVMHLSQALAEGGWLIVTPIEAPYVKEKSLCPINVNNYLFFQKKSAATSVERPGKNIEENVAWQTPSNYVKENVPLDFSRKGSTAAIQTATLFKENNIASLPSLSVHSNMPAGLDQKQTIEQIHLLADTGRLAEAKELCEQALALSKVDSQLHFLHATILHVLGDNEGALAAFKSVLFLDQSSALAHFMSGFLLKRQGATKEAARHYRNALQLLERYADDEIVPGSKEMSVGFMRDIIKAS